MTVKNLRQTKLARGSIGRIIERHKQKIVTAGSAVSLCSEKDARVKGVKHVAIAEHKTDNLGLVLSVQVHAQYLCGISHALLRFPTHASAAVSDPRHRGEANLCSPRHGLKCGLFSQRLSYSGPQICSVHFRIRHSPVATKCSAG